MKGMRLIAHQVAEVIRRHARWNSTLVATAAMIHTIAVLPNAIIGEYFPHYAPFFAELGELHIDITSSIATIGDAPGLGVRMYEDALASHEY